jgi:hypothetical protein
MRLNWNHWIRRIHRWLSILFTGTVVLNLVALARNAQAQWVGFLALVPLIPLLITGLYLFVLPYVARTNGQGAGG